MNILHYLCIVESLTQNVQIMKTLKSWTAKQYIANLNPVVVKHEVDADGVCVLVNTSKGKKAMGFWIDFWIDEYGELDYEYNQDTFFMWNDIDCIRKEMQDNTDFWELMTSAALSYIEKNNLIAEKRK